MKNNIINQVIILSLIMIVGVYARKKDILSKEASKSFSNFLTNVTLPCLLISSFNYSYSQDMIEKARIMFAYSIIIHIVLILVSRVLTFKYPENSKKVLRFATIFSNCGFMGYPVLESLFGKIGIFYGAIFNIPFNIFMFSIGIMIYTGKKDLKTLKEVLVNSAIIATILGLIIFSFSIKLPYPLFTAMSIVGSMTTPLSMIIVGAMLSEIRVKDIFSGTLVYYVSFLRLIAVPFLTLGILKLLNADKLLMQIAVIIEAMPAAVLASVLAEKYGADTALASRSVFISTIISMITIPFIVMFL
ncbi:AEC family transporter [Clostridium aciditolerans]|uniref:AEC family transporter n=1 Tax=Clostridium aciditolerans TaxID=339861 RepID=A0A934I2P5_9CLOT|nr:AEC family transporter [Clostridium aciditolerans]MBI6873926.1 AEC family transporter [Clostridium aciditolerans]